MFEAASKLKSLKEKLQGNCSKVKNDQKPHRTPQEVLKLNDRKVEIIPILAYELTEEQIAEFRNAFFLFDEDRDGRITRGEIKKIMKTLGQNPSDREVNDMLSGVDCDGSGSIDFPQFLVLMANKLSTVNMAEEITKAFRTFDKDNDGVMSSKDVKDMLQNYGEKMFQEEIEEFISIADTNSDGEINYAEFASKLELDII